MNASAQRQAIRNMISIAIERGEKEVSFYNGEPIKAQTARAFAKNNNLKYECAKGEIFISWP